MSDRFLRRLPPHERLERASGLEMLARARATYGLLPDARTALTELQEIAKAAPTEGIRAAVCGVEGAVALAEGDFETARRALEDAVDLCERAGGAFEAARARIDLARALAGLRRIPEAEREARAGLAKAESLGALPEAERARALLAELTPESLESPAGTALAGLTRREGEVLSLVAEGLSNAEIGSRLFVSEHTIKRHVANILRKLDLTSRAAAAARFAASAKPRPD
jgi:ATP/maltotriose-dependent transcriptional regulator MalT